jgi:type I restriction enzyme S subunit
MTIQDFDFARLNTGTGVPSMTASIINRLSIVLPPNDLLQKTDKLLSGLFAQANTLRTAIDTLIQTRDELLPLLMNGQVVVK